MKLYMQPNKLTTRSLYLLNFPKYNILTFLFEWIKEGKKDKLVYYLNELRLLDFGGTHGSCHHQHHINLLHANGQYLKHPPPPSPPLLLIIRLNRADHRITEQKKVLIIICLSKTYQYFFYQKYHRIYLYKNSQEFI